MYIKQPMSLLRYKKPGNWNTQAFEIQSVLPEHKSHIKGWKDTPYIYIRHVYTIDQSPWVHNKVYEVIDYTRDVYNNICYFKSMRLKPV